MKKNTILIPLLAAAVILAGGGSALPAGAASQDSAGIFSDRDFEDGYDESTSTVIRLDGDTAVCDSDAVRISGSRVTITRKGTYILTGTLEDGMVIVETDKSDKVQLVLDNVDIHSQTSAPLYILQADKVFLTLAEGSANTLSNGGTFNAVDENEIDAVLFSKEDLTLNGSGTLAITSPAGHGIVSKDSLRFTGGVYDISCSSHAISGKDEVSIAGGDFTLVSGKDGIHAENNDDDALGYACIAGGAFRISSEGDGISASSQVQISGGSFSITAGGGTVNAAAHNSENWGGFMGGGRRGGWGGNVNGASADAAGSSSDEESTSMKGVKAGTELLVSGGSFTVDSADDSFHSNGSLFVNGGTFEIASGDDAFHADETLAVSDGMINITQSYEGLEGLHVEVSGGEITLLADDDGVNAAGGTDLSGSTGGRDGMFGSRGGMSSSDGSILISGGILSVTAYGDGLDANGTLEITGGSVTVCGPTQGDTATLDYDVSGTISGGTFIGTGGSGMAQTFSDSEQGVVSVSVGNQPAGTTICLTDSDGNNILTCSPALDFAVVILSCPDIISGKAYTITVGSASGEFTAS